MTFRERSFRGRFSVESLCDVLESEVRKKSTVGIDRVTVKSFARDLRGNVEIISRKVLEGSYHLQIIPRCLCLRLLVRFRANYASQSFAIKLR